MTRTFLVREESVISLIGEPILKWQNDNSSLEISSAQNHIILERE
jgi:hypothetical protein